jgi:hypothetical protein
VLYFDKMPDARLAPQTMRDSLLFYSRFRTWPVFDASTGLCTGWREPLRVDEVRVEDHLIEHEVADRHSLAVLIDRLSAQSIRIDRPCWELHLVRIKSGTCPSICFFACLLIIPANCMCIKVVRV